MIPINLIDNLSIDNDSINKTTEDASAEELKPPSSLSNDSNKAMIMRISSSIPLNFSSQYYLTEDLSLAKHNTLLESFPRPFIALNLDPYIMGVGGDDSWTSCVHEDYLLQPDKYNFDFKFSFYSE